jgi:hypothetical protein
LDGEDRNALKSVAADTRELLNEADLPRLLDVWRWARWVGVFDHFRLKSRRRQAAP